MLAAIVTGMRVVCIQEIMGLMGKIRPVVLLFYVVSEEVLCVNSMLHCTWKTTVFCIMLMPE